VFASQSGRVRFYLRSLRTIRGLQSGAFGVAIPEGVTATGATQPKSGRSTPTRCAASRGCGKEIVLLRVPFCRTRVQSRRPFLRQHSVEAKTRAGQAPGIAGASGGRPRTPVEGTHHPSPVERRVRPRRVYRRPALRSAARRNDDCAAVVQSGQRQGRNPARTSGPGQVSLGNVRQVVAFRLPSGTPTPETAVRNPHHPRKKDLSTTNRHALQDRQNGFAHSSTVSRRSVQSTPVSMLMVPYFNSCNL